MLIPEVKNVNGIWRGKIKLDAWNEFWEEEWLIDLNLGGDKIVTALDSKYNVGYEYLINNQKELLKVILKELLVNYPIMQEEYGYDDDELAEYMPNIGDIEGFKSVIQPEGIYILDVEKDGLPYIGFHFKCTWDDEHDYGIMLYKDHVIKMGGADMAFLSWIATEDKNTAR